MRFRFSLFALLAFVTAVGLVLAFPRYFLIVALLFGGVVTVLTLLGAMRGKLPAEKIPTPTRDPPGKIE
jgi:hypothetical protein